MSRYGFVEAVETFVDQHYAESIESIDRDNSGRSPPSLQALCALFISSTGCGAGVMCEPLAARGARVVGGGCHDDEHPRRGAACERGGRIALLA